jgi:hypothetical protein
MAFFTFTLLSGLLSYNMFSQLSNDPLEKALLSIVAIALEAFKIFTLVRANTLKKLGLGLQAIRAYFMYGALAVIAILASFGYTLVVVNRAQTEASGQGVQLHIDLDQKQLDAIKAQETNIQKQIDELTLRLHNTPPDYVSTANALSNAITKAQTSLSATIALESPLNTDITNFKLQQIKSSTASGATTNMFQLMAKTLFNMSQSLLTLLILLTISVMIELGIISTSPVIPIDRDHLSHILGEFSNDIDVDALIEAKERKLKSRGKRKALPPPPESKRKFELSKLPKFTLPRLAFPWSKKAEGVAEIQPTRPSALAAEIGEVAQGFFDAVGKNAPRPEVEVSQELAPSAEVKPKKAPRKPRTIKVLESDTRPIEVLPPVLTAPQIVEYSATPAPTELSFKSVGQTLVEMQPTLEEAATPVADPVTPEDAGAAAAEQLVPEIAKLESHLATPEEFGKLGLRMTPQVDVTVAPMAPPVDKIVDQKAVPDDVGHLIVGNAGPKIVKPVRSMAPQEVGSNVKAYRFGKTTEAVRDMFIQFVEAIFDKRSEGEPLNDPVESGAKIGLKPGMPPLFISRLTDLKGESGLHLVELREDPETNEKQYYPNYTKGYIISAATQEVKVAPRG